MHEANIPQSPSQVKRKGRPRKERSPRAGREGQTIGRIIEGRLDILPKPLLPSNGNASETHGNGDWKYAPIRAAGLRIETGAGPVSHEAARNSLALTQSSPGSGSESLRPVSPNPPGGIRANHPRNDFVRPSPADVRLDVLVS